MNHDQNFKNLILDYPHQAPAFFAAEEAANQVSDDEVTPVPQEQLKDRPAALFHPPIGTLLPGPEWT